MTLTNLLRDLAPHVTGVLARRFGDWAAAEDAVQDACIAAHEQWPVAGVPTNSKGWLYQVAVRRLHDQVRSEIARRRREDQVALERAAEAPWAPRRMRSWGPRRMTRSSSSSCAPTRR